MKTLLFFACLCLVACTAPEKAVFSPDNLESYFVTVDASKDTLLRTPKGAFVKIKKGTFAENIELEIKEAYTVKDMLLAGLATESNGRPLRSGGMIYLNTKDKEEVVPQKPITVLLPTNGVEEGMKIFKGEEKGDSINWVEADTLTPTVDEAMLRNGKAIYVANCATCHAIQKPLVGPALANVRNRGPWLDFSNVVRWVHNPGAFIPTTAYTRKLAAMHNGQIMPSFPQLSEYDVAAVMSFVKNESGKAVTDTFALPQYPQAADTASDINEVILPDDNLKPCFDTNYISERDTLQLTADYANELLNDTLPKPTDSLINSEEMQGLRNGFTDFWISDGAYQFEIKTLGWYNVDAYVLGQPGTTLCELGISINGNGEEAKLNVYAFFPRQKNLSVGIPHESNVFRFEKVDGKIPLYLGEKGTVVVFGNQRDQFYFGTAHFTVRASQTISVTVRKATEEELLKAVKSENIEGINMDMVRQKMMVNPCDPKPSPSGDSTAAAPAKEILK